MRPSPRVARDRPTDHRPALGRRGGARWRALAPGGAPVALFVLLGLAGPCLAPFSAGETVDATALGARPPGSHIVLAGGAQPHAGMGRPLLLPLGTDGLGRDVLSRMLHGARNSLTIAGGAVLLATLLGVGFGTLAGLGGWTANAATTGTTALLAFPRLFLLVALAALLPPGKWTVTLTLAATGWMTLARVVDGELRSLLRRPFVEAARVSGVRTARLVFRHLVPHLATPIAVVATSMVGEVILAEAALSFLGLGIPPPEPSWGGMAAEATPNLLSAWWLAAFPASPSPSPRSASSCWATGCETRWPRPAGDQPARCSRRSRRTRSATCSASRWSSPQRSRYSS